jgi:two-component system sensor histidine kinase SenX3
MIDGLAALGAGMLGILVGVIAGLAFRFSKREQPAEPPTDPPKFDEGVTAVLSVLPAATVVTATGGRVVRASAAAHAHGLVREDRVVHAVLRDLIAQVARDGEIQETEVELLRGRIGSDAVPLHVRVAPLGASHVLLLAEDRTEARRLDAVRRDFAVNASHELKTPVGAVSLLADAIQAAAEDPEAVRRFAGRMQVESARLSALVQDILQLSRVQAPGAVGPLVPVDVSQVIADAIDRVRTPAAARRIAIETGGDPAVVLGDHDLLVTVVRNLLDNAVAYSDPGTRIAVGTTVRGDDSVEIAVVDQGIGIPAATQTRVFERFYRVDPARSRDTGGTGLGLSIVKHVVEDHGGEVALWSEPGHGTTFTVRLPLAPGGDA